LLPWKKKNFPEKTIFCFPRHPTTMICSDLYFSHPVIIAWIYSSNHVIIDYVKAIPHILLLSFVRYYLWHPVIIIRAILSLTSCYYRSCDTISDILLLLFVRYYLWHPVIIVCMDVIPDIMLLFLAWILFLTSCYYCLCGFYSTHHVFVCVDAIPHIPW
jgi:hypothetical protein